MQSPKKESLDQNINTSKSYICNSFFENVISVIQLWSTRSSGHHQSFFLFQIFQQKVSKSIKTSEKDHSFYNTVSFKKHHSFYEPRILTMKIMCSQNTAKKLSQFTNFSANMFLFGLRKNFCTAPFPDFQELLSWRTL